MGNLPTRRPLLFRALRIGIAVALLAVFVLAFYWYHEFGWKGLFVQFKSFLRFRQLRDFILSFGTYGAVIFVFLQALQVLFAPVPGELTGFVGGYLYGKVLGTTLSTIGLVLGSQAAFELTRIVGARFVRRVVRKEAMDHFDEFVTHRGLNIAFILFLVPGFPKDSLCYLLGLTHMRRTDFFLMNLFGRLPGTLLLTIEGEALRTGKYQAFFTLLAGSILLMVLLYFFRNRIIHVAALMVGAVLGKGHRRP